MTNANPKVGQRYSDGETEHEVVGVADGEVDVVEYEEDEKIGEYTIDAETFLDRMVE